jgi:hypothetical protein
VPCVNLARYIVLINAKPIEEMRENLVSTRGSLQIKGTPVGKMNLMKSIVLAVSFVALIFGYSETSYSDVVPSDERQEPVSPKTHAELPESSPSSPPLSTDDPGTPGPLGVEINLIGTGDYTSAGRTLSGGVDANLGIGEYVQLRLEKEAANEFLKSADEESSFGSTNFGVKWRFYDNKNLKFAFYPSLDLDDATNSEKVGRSIYLPLIISKTIGEYTVIFNGGFTRNLDYNEKKANFFSIAAGRAIGEEMRIMAEVSTQLNEDERRNDLRIGFVHEFGNEKSAFEEGIFGSIGHSFGATSDGIDHTTVIIGISLAKKPTGT